MGCRIVTAVLIASVAALIAASHAGADTISTQINQRGVDGAFAFTVSGTITDDEGWSGVAPQGVYVEVFMTVENIGRTSQTYQADYQRLVDGAGRVYSPDIRAINALNEGGAGPLAINPGNRPVAALFFDVPKNTRASQTCSCSTPLSVHPELRSL